MQSRLMLIISHSVVKEADGGTPRTQHTGLALNEAGGSEAADWLPGRREFRLHVKILKTFLQTVF